MWYDPRMENPSLIRFLHASPNSPAVDIYVNDRLVISGLPYKRYTSYYQILPGMYTVQIYPAGNKEQLVLETMLNIPPNAIFTGAAINKLEEIEVYPISDMNYEALSASNRSNEINKTCGCSMHGNQGYYNQMMSQCTDSKDNNMYQQCQIMNEEKMKQNQGPMMYEENNMMCNQGPIMYNNNNMMYNQGQMMCNQGPIMFYENNMMCNQAPIMCMEGQVNCQPSQMVMDNSCQMMYKQNEMMNKQNTMLYNKHCMNYGQEAMKYCPGQMIIEEEMIEAPGDIRECEDCKDKQMSFARFIHLSPNAPAVDITLPDGRVVFSNVDYKDVTDYIQLMPGDYTFQVKPFGIDQVVLTIPNITVEPGKVYSLYAVGLVGETPPLEALALLDGE